MILPPEFFFFFARETIDLLRDLTFSNGRRICDHCRGTTRIKCPRCDGSGRLITFTQLVVNWFVHESEQVFTEDALGLPADKIKRASGVNVMFEEGIRVRLGSSIFDAEQKEFPRSVSHHNFLGHHFQALPLTNAPIEKLRIVSSRMAEHHETSWIGVGRGEKNYILFRYLVPQFRTAMIFFQERILMQKHSLDCIAVTRVLASWKDKRFTYWIYGIDNQAFAPEYPQAGCCWCCTIM